MLGSAPVVADAIVDQLARPTDKATDAGACSSSCNVCSVACCALL